MTCVLAAAHALLGKGTRVPRSCHFGYVESPRDGAEAILGFIGKHPVADR